MYETKLIFKQTPPPYFCLKVVCKKGSIFSGAYGTIVADYCPIVMNPTTTRKIMRSTPNLVLFQCRSLSIVCVQLEQLCVQYTKYGSVHI